MRILKKYPNRRLYDTQESVYVTLEDVRTMVLDKDPLQILDSKTGKDLTRSVLLQIIAEQEAEGHEPLLTNKVLQQIIRFYGDSMQGVLGRYLEQSIMTFLDQQELYQRRMREVLNANPIKLMQRLADQNLSFLRSMMQGESANERRSEAGPDDLADVRDDQDRNSLDLPGGAHEAAEEAEEADKAEGTDAEGADGAPGTNVRADPE